MNATNVLQTTDRALFAIWRLHLK